MKTIRLLGPMEERSYKTGAGNVTHVKGKAIEVDDQFADECLSMNPDKLTVEQAAPYGIPVYELVTKGGSAPKE